MSKFLHILAEPAWQGVGALIALTALVIAIRFERRRNHKKKNYSPSPSLPVKDLSATVNVSPYEHEVRYFAIIDDESEQSYYAELAKHIRNAKETIYRLGRGFYHPGRIGFYDQIIRAEEAALKQGVDITRIQGNSPVAKIWADGYARLCEQYSNLHIKAELDNMSLNDICLIDPRGYAPVVNFLFETKEPGHLGHVGRPVIAIFVMNARNLATTLADQFIMQADKLDDLGPVDVRNLACTYIYFGWGVHMSSNKMLGDVPDAQPLGVAILRKWRRNIEKMVSGPAIRATIYPTTDPSDWFDGVAYELSWWGKARLDRLEKRAYREVRVSIELRGSTQQAFTYIPLPPVTPESQLAHGSWIYEVARGAYENKMDHLLAELRSAGVRFDEFEHDML